MLLSQKNIRELAEVAIIAATKAGAVIKEYFDKPIEVVSKSNEGSLATQVLTVVDELAQGVILNEINPTLEQYDLGLLTEEKADDNTRFTKDYFWCIDPLDGTLPFIEKTTGFSVAIALVSNSGVVQLGVVYDPQEENLYHAIIREGAFKNRAKWEPLNQINQGLTFVTDRSFLDTPRIDEVKQFLKEENSGEEVRIIKHGGAAMNVIWTLENAPACYFKFPKPKDGGGSLWDYAAATCIAIEAGACATNSFGKQLDLNRKDTTFMNHEGILFCTDPELQVALIEFYSA